LPAGQGRASYASVLEKNTLENLDIVACVYQVADRLDGHGIWSIGKAYADGSDVGGMVNKPAMDEDGSAG
jgi:hypothetical protein